MARNQRAIEIAVIMVVQLHGVTEVFHVNVHLIQRDQMCINSPRAESSEQTVDSIESNITMYG